MNARDHKFVDRVQTADLFRFQRLNRGTLSLTTYTEMILDIVTTKVEKHARTRHYKSVVAIQVANTSAEYTRRRLTTSANTLRSALNKLRRA
jgi:hypothetical protein